MLAPCTQAENGLTWHTDPKPMDPNLLLNLTVLAQKCEEIDSGIHFDVIKI